MNFATEILFFFSVLGAFNGLILSFYFLCIIGKKHMANVFLGITLLLLSLRTGKSAFFYFNDHLAEQFIQLGIIACFFIGPFLYFYVYTVCHSQHRAPNWKAHLLFLIPLILAPIIFYPYYAYRGLWSDYLMWMVYFVWLVYMVLSLRLIIPVVLQRRNSSQKAKPEINWMLHVAGGVVIVWLAYVIGGYISYIVGAITFSVISYLLVIFMINTKQKKAFFLTPANDSNTYFDDKRVRTILNDLQLLFEVEHMYRQPSLKCSDVAKRLEIPTYQLSQLINQALGKNFNELVNAYRIKAAEKMLRSNTQFTIEAIGEECGFKSKSTFYAAFKKITGTTPAKFV